MNKRKINSSWIIEQSLKLVLSIEMQWLYYNALFCSTSTESMKIMQQTKSQHWNMKKLNWTLWLMFRYNDLNDCIRGHIVISESYYFFISIHFLCLSLFIFNSFSKIYNSIFYTQHLNTHKLNCITTTIFNLSHSMKLIELKEI